MDREGRRNALSTLPGNETLTEGVPVQIDRKSGGGASLRIARGAGLGIASLATSVARASGLRCWAQQSQLKHATLACGVGHRSQLERRGFDLLTAGALMDAPAITVNYRLCNWPVAFTLTDN